MIYSTCGFAHKVDVGVGSFVCWPPPPSPSSIHCVWGEGALAQKAILPPSPLQIHLSVWSASGLTFSSSSQRLSLKIKRVVKRREVRGGGTKKTNKPLSDMIQKKITTRGLADLITKKVLYLFFFFA